MQCDSPPTVWVPSVSFDTGALQICVAELDWGPLVMKSARCVLAVKSPGKQERAGLLLAYNRTRRSCLWSARPCPTAGTHLSMLTKAVQGRAKVRLRFSFNPDTSATNTGRTPVQAPLFSPTGCRPKIAFSFSNDSGLIPQSSRTMIGVCSTYLSGALRVEACAPSEHSVHSRVSLVSPVRNFMGGGRLRPITKFRKRFVTVVTWLPLPPSPRLFIFRKSPTESVIALAPSVGRWPPLSRFPGQGGRLSNSLDVADRSTSGTLAELNLLGNLFYLLTHANIMRRRNHTCSRWERGRRVRHFSFHEQLSFCFYGRVSIIKENNHLGV